MELPAIDIQPADTGELDRAIQDLGSYHWLVFTSVNGVAAFFQQLSCLGRDSRALYGLKIGAIGPATAAALESKGIAPDYVPKVYTGRGFVEGLKKWGIGGKRFLLPRADIADRELVDGIRELGAEAQEITAYRTVPALESLSKARERLRAGEIDVVTFTSSSTVSNLVAAFEGNVPVISGVRIACIGPKTAETAAAAGLRVDILAGEHTIPGLVAAMEDYFRTPEPGR